MSCSSKKWPTIWCLFVVFLPMKMGWMTSGWFQSIFVFTATCGEMIQFDEYFSKGLKPPTRSLGGGFCWNFTPKLWELITKFDGQICPNGWKKPPPPRWWFVIHDSFCVVIFFWMHGFAACARLTRAFHGFFKQLSTETGAGELGWHAAHDFFGMI